MLSQSQCSTSPSTLPWAEIVCLLLIRIRRLYMRCTSAPPVCPPTNSLPPSPTRLWAYVICCRETRARPNIYFSSAEMKTPHCLQRTALSVCRLYYFNDTTVCGFVYPTATVLLCYPEPKTELQVSSSPSNKSLLRTFCNSKTGVFQLLARRECLPMHKVVLIFLCFIRRNSDLILLSIEFFSLGRATQI